MNLGVFGGTFDPIHYGHLRIAERAREEAGLDEILFVPVGDPVHRTHPPRASAEHRFQMCRNAVEFNPHFRASRIETEHRSPGFTIDTLRILQGERPQANFHLIIGGDEAVLFPSWRDPHDILKIARLVVATRPGLDEETLRRSMPDWQAERTTILSPLSIDISATAIRELVRAGRSIRYLVPEAVRKFIEDYQLYQA